MPNPAHPESPRAEARGPQPIPYTVVVQLFEQLTLAYGQPFLARWDGVNLATVHEDWRYKLAGLTPTQLAWGLDHLVAGRPPEAMTFRQWCEAAPQPTSPLALPDKRKPQPLPPQVREAVAALLEPPPREEPHRIEVARRYIEKWGGVDNLTPTQRQYLAFYQRVIERFERMNEETDRIAAAKEATQAAVDQYQQEHGHEVQVQPQQSA